MQETNEQRMKGNDLKATTCDQMLAEESAVRSNPISATREIFNLVQFSDLRSMKRSAESASIASNKNQRYSRIESKLTEIFNRFPPRFDRMPQNDCK